MFTLVRTRVYTHSHTQARVQKKQKPSRGKVVNRNRPRDEPNIETNRAQLQNNQIQYIKDLMEK